MSTTQKLIFCLFFFVTYETIGTSLCVEIPKTICLVRTETDVISQLIIYSDRSSLGYITHKFHVKEHRYTNLSTRSFYYTKERRPCSTSPHLLRVSPSPFLLGDSFLHHSTTLVSFKVHFLYCLRCNRCSRR